MAGDRYRRAAAVALAGVMAGALAPALAGPITLNGITFSDELGGFTLLAGSGSGAPADPFVLVERLSGDGPAVLIIRGMSAAFGNPLRTNHYVGFALTKVAINGGARPWRTFTLELQLPPGVQSTYFDGLSFGQAERSRRIIAADRFAGTTVVDEPADAIRFAGGEVAPGERVVMNLVITDNSPRAEFYLVQRHPELMSGAEGATLAAAGSDGAPPTPDRPVKKAAKIYDRTLRQAQDEVDLSQAFTLTLSLSKCEGGRAPFSAAC